MRGVKLLAETGLSGQKPVMMKNKSKVRKWRRQEKRITNMKYEKLKEENIKEQLKRKVRKKWDTRGDLIREDGTNLKMMSE